MIQLKTPWGASVLRSFTGSVIFILCLGIGNLKHACAETTFIVDYQIDYVQKILEDAEKNHSKIAAKFKRPGSIQNQQELAQLQYEGERLTKLLEVGRTILTMLKDKRDLFRRHGDFEDCDIYCSDDVDPAPYELEVKKVTQLFEKLFPGVSFAFQTRPQILIYPNASDYSRFEGTPSGVLGHQISGRSSQAMAMAQFVGAVNRKFHFVISYHRKDFDVFRHELAHLFLDRFVDPNYLSVDSQQTSNFLNEGFAENVSAVFNEKVYQQRVLSLVNQGQIKPLKSLGNMLNAHQSVQLSAEETRDFYSEATLFVRWASTLPEGFQLIKQLIKAKDEEHESVLKNFQSTHGLERIGFKSYDMWRAAELDQLWKKFRGHTDSEKDQPLDPT